MSKLQFTDWRKSSYSSNGSNCVEVARAAGAVGVRDSKRPEGGHLTVSGPAWDRFLTGVRAGKFDI